MIYQEYEMTEIYWGNRKRKVCPECKNHKQIIQHDIPDDIECREIDCKNTYIISDRDGKYVTEGQCQCYSLSHIDKKLNKSMEVLK